MVEKAQKLVEEFCIFQMPTKSSEPQVLKHVSNEL